MAQFEASVILILRLAFSPERSRRIRMTDFWEINFHQNLKVHRYVEAERIDKLKVMGFQYYFPCQAKN